MGSHSRREFLRGGIGGLATGFGLATLPANALPTEPSGTLGTYVALLQQDPEPTVEPAKKWAPTADNILGPFHRPAAPFRAKITPPLEPGVVLVIRGRVWGFDSKKPLASAILDVWQANAKGRYDNDDPRNPPAKEKFVNRARLITDENGFYEYETIRPGAYKIGPDTWRPAHIHYLVRAKGYRQLVTQLYFEGDAHNATDDFIKPSLVITTTKAKTGEQIYETGTFDIVLASER